MMRGQIIAAMSTSERQYFLNSYGPLVATPFGRAAALKHDLLPFIDGSIRREPDLEHEFPSISCLCRAGKFAPRLRLGDVVAYMTVKRRYGNAEHRHRRLTAVLRVKHVLPSHAEAAEWYRSRGLPLPSNCMVAGNPPKPLAQSHMLHGQRNGRGPSGSCSGLQRSWDAGYRLRASKYPVFIVCDRIFRDLSWDAPAIDDAHLIGAFGRVPATQNPGKLPAEGFRELLRPLDISVPLFAL